MKMMKEKNMLSSHCYLDEFAVLGFYSDSQIFQQWFVGFSDAESSFIIHKVLDKNGNISKFSFMFTIDLHIDDLHTLEFIKNKLELGNIRIYKDKCIFTISDKQGVYKLISIFDKFNLNTTKYLDYLKFKDAFILIIFFKPLSVKCDFSFIKFIIFSKSKKSALFCVNNWYFLKWGIIIFNKSSFLISILFHFVCNSPLFSISYYFVCFFIWLYLVWEDR